jgi:hypothetical protein
VRAATKTAVLFRYTPVLTRAGPPRGSSELGNVAEGQKVERHAGVTPVPGATARPAVLRYAAALGIVLASGVLQRVLIQAVGPLPPFVTLYPAVVFVALLAGER